MEAATPRPHVSSGALTPAPGHNLTHSARGDMVMCPGPLRMECISWEEPIAAAGGPQKLLRQMAQLRMGSVSNMIQGKRNIEKYLISIVLTLSLTVVPAPSPTQTMRR